MYDARLIAEKLDALQHLAPHGYPDYSADDTRAITQQIQDTRDSETGAILRALTPEEEAFVVGAKVRVTVDAPYFLEHFVWIDEEGHGLRPLYPLWESQRFVLNRLATLEWKHQQAGHPDGILVNVLKARQLGISTLAESLVAHRIFTQNYVRAIAGSDVEAQARYLFRMVERIYAHLPWFLKPGKKVPYSAGSELNLDNDSSLRSAWGKTTRGALQETGGKKGNIERGRTNSVVHISELATWDNPEQLDTALFPGIPVAPDSLVVLESTAELAGDWWHLHWQACEEGATPRDWSDIFIPWCVEPKKYSLPAPLGWTPSTKTLKVAQQIEQEMPRYVGEKVTLSRDQLYWYETTRQYYQKKNRVFDFLKEYPSNPQECFQYAGRSVFSLEDLERIDAGARPLLDVWRVEPAKEIAELRRMSEEPAPEEPRAQFLKRDRRPAAPSVIRPISKAASDFQVPSGYGFRRLSKDELDDLPSLRHSVLSIWEYPRFRGKRRYVISVDVGDGLGQDYSVISVVREPTIEEPAEEVAQFVSNTIRPSHLAFVTDAIGRLYCDEDRIEAQAAIELNNHGVTVQDLLQLHLGYANFYVWEVVDAAQAESRFTKRIGWTTTMRTRPILLEKFHDAVTTIDPISGLADFRLNSPITRAEMRFFVTEGLLGEAEHAKGQHDDAIFASAIGYYVAHRLAGGEAEPIAERRRRREAIKALRAQEGDTFLAHDFRNSEASAEETDLGVDDAGEFDDSASDGNLYFDPRNADSSD